jgi:hypothetical protein
MPALARAAGASHPSPSRPDLSLVQGTRRRRTPRPASVALYATGMVLGFLLAAAASAPGGGVVVGVQLALAALAAVVAVGAALRARAVGARPHTARATGRGAAAGDAGDAPGLRRAA